MRLRTTRTAVRVALDESGKLQLGVGERGLVALAGALQDLLVQAEGGEAIGEAGLQEPEHLLKVRIGAQALQGTEQVVDPPVDVLRRRRADLDQRGAEARGQIGMAAGPVEHAREHGAAHCRIRAERLRQGAEIVPVRVEVPQLERPRRRCRRSSAGP